MRLTAHIEGVGLIGPGFDNWPAARAVLAGEAVYAAAPANLPAPAALPPSERRRASRAIKVALGVGFEAIAAAGLDASTLPTVFSASAGDGDNCHEICQQLATADRQISPTRFHNSVHNAPAGYWGIASGAMASSSVLCAHDASFGAGLLEAIAQVAVDATRVALIVYDTDYPEPLRATRPVPDAFGLALVLSPDTSDRALAAIRVQTTDQPALPLADAALEQMRRSFPAARALPLLQALATASRGTTRDFVIDYLPDIRLAIEVSA
jgi:hypothetical protein